VPIDFPGLIGLIQIEKVKPGDDPSNLLEYLSQFFALAYFRGNTLKQVELTHTFDGLDGLPLHEKEPQLQEETPAAQFLEII